MQSIVMVRPDSPQKRALARQRENGKYRSNTYVVLLFCLVIAASLPMQSQIFTTLHVFGPGPDGARPRAGVIRDAAGNLYGTTEDGGEYGAGTVFELDSSGGEILLYSFRGAPNDGKRPFGAVVRDSAGNLYGTTAEGGPCGCGTIFRLDASGNETVLHNFYYPVHGQYPESGVIRDSAGNLYGVAGGGVSLSGVIFKLANSGEFRVLHSFDGVNGAATTAALIHDASDNLYGTAAWSGPLQQGTIFKFDRYGRGEVLHQFSGGTDGERPESRLIFDDAGNLYGTTLYGGSSNYGTIYKIDVAGTESILYSFTGGPDGLYPSGGLAIDSDGNFFGTTVGDGFTSLGTVFELHTTGRLTVLHSFHGRADGGGPLGDLIRDNAGNLYGTTWGGGQYDFGTVFKIAP